MYRPSFPDAPTMQTFIVATGSELPYSAGEGSTSRGGCGFGYLSRCSVHPRARAACRCGRGNQPALIYDSPVTDTVATFTYADMRDAVAHFAGALQASGVERGDRVIVY